MSKDDKIICAGVFIGLVVDLEMKSLVCRQKAEKQATGNAYELFMRVVGGALVPPTPLVYLSDFVLRWLTFQSEGHVAGCITKKNTSSGIFGGVMDFDRRGMADGRSSRHGGLPKRGGVRTSFFLRWGSRSFSHKWFEALQPHSCLVWLRNIISLKKTRIT